MSKTLEIIKKNSTAVMALCLLAGYVNSATAAQAGKHHERSSRPDSPVAGFDQDKALLVDEGMPSAKDEDFLLGILIDEVDGPLPLDLRVPSDLDSGMRSQDGSRATASFGIGSSPTGSPKKVNYGISEKSFSLKKTTLSGAVEVAKEQLVAKVVLLDECLLKSFHDRILGWFGHSSNPDFFEEEKVRRTTPNDRVWPQLVTFYKGSSVRAWESVVQNHSVPPIIVVLAQDKLNSLGKVTKKIPKKSEEIALWGCRCNAKNDDKEYGCLQISVDSSGNCYHLFFCPLGFVKPETELSATPIKTEENFIMARRAYKRTPLANIKKHLTKDTGPRPLYGSERLNGFFLGNYFFDEATHTVKVWMGREDQPYYFIFWQNEKSDGAAALA